MVPSLAGIDPQIEGVAAAGAHEDRGPFRRKPGPVRRDQDVGPHAFAQLRADFAQAGRAGLFTGLDQVLGVEAQPPARFQHGPERRHVDGVLALVVDDSAPIPAITRIAQCPGRAAFGPFGIHAADDVAMAVAQHSERLGILDAFGQQERTLALRVRDDLGGKPHRLEVGDHLVGEVAQEIAGALRVLALGRDGDAARQHGLEGSRRKPPDGASDGGFAGHECSPSGISGTSRRRSRCHRCGAHLRWRCGCPARR